jgi:hypothetical protein
LKQQTGSDSVHELAVSKGDSLERKKKQTVWLRKVRRMKLGEHQ